MAAHSHQNPRVSNTTITNLIYSAFPAVTIHNIRKSVSVPGMTLALSSVTRGNRAGLVWGKTPTRRSSDGRNLHENCRRTRMPRNGAIAAVTPRQARLR